MAVGSNVNVGMVSVGTVMVRDVSLDGRVGICVVGVTETVDTTVLAVDVVDGWVLPELDVGCDDPVLAVSDVAVDVGVDGDVRRVVPLPSSS